MYKSVRPRSFALTYRNMGTYRFTTNAEGNSGVGILQTRQVDYGPAMLQWSQYFRIAKVTYEFKQLHNVSAMPTTEVGSISPMKMSTTNYSVTGPGGFAGPAPTGGTGLGAVSTHTTLDKSDVAGLPIPTTNSGQSFGLPTLYWCQPMAANVTPIDVRDMIQRWPRVRQKRFGISRRMVLNIPPYVYKRHEISNTYVGNATGTADMTFAHNVIKRGRAPWFLSAGPADPAVEGSPELVMHGTTFMGCRGSGNVIYTFEVTKQVVFEFRGHQVVAPGDITKVIPAAT